MSLVTHVYRPPDPGVANWAGGGRSSGPRVANRAGRSSGPGVANRAGRSSGRGVANWAGGGRSFGPANGRDLCCRGIGRFFRFLRMGRRVLCCRGVVRCFRLLRAGGRGLCRGFVGGCRPLVRAEGGKLCCRGVGGCFRLLRAGGRAGGPTACCDCVRGFMRAEGGEPGCRRVGRGRRPSRAGRHCPCCRCPCCRCPCCRCRGRRRPERGNGADLRRGGLLHPARHARLGGPVGGIRRTLSGPAGPGRCAPPARPGGMALAGRALWRGTPGHQGANGWHLTGQAHRGYRGHGQQAGPRRPDPQGQHGGGDHGVDGDCCAAADDQHRHRVKPAQQPSDGHSGGHHEKQEKKRHPQR
jgi:hypothetical protein